MNEAAQFLCAGPHESLNLWPWGDVPRARGDCTPLPSRAGAGRSWLLTVQPFLEVGNQGLGIAVGAGVLGEACQRTTNCATARPERLQFISALICKECLPRAPNGRCPGLIASCRISCQPLPPTLKKTVFIRFIPAHKPGQGVGMWRRALGIHDH